MKVVLILYFVTGTTPVMDQFPDKGSCDAVAAAVKKAWPDRYAAHICYQFKK